MVIKPLFTCLVGVVHMSVVFMEVKRRHNIRTPVTRFTDGLKPSDMGARTTLSLALHKNCIKF